MFNTGEYCSVVAYPEAMKALQRVTIAAAVLCAAAFGVAGCATSNPDDAVTDDSSTGEETPSTGPADDSFEFELAWLDAGRMVAIVTQGSSTCVPVLEDVTADGQHVTVTLNEGDANQVCTADLTSRATLVPLPAGVDPKSDVDFVVTLGSATGDEDLDGNASLAGVPGEPTDYLPSAGWVEDSALVLLTWGSSSCPPIIDSVEAGDGVGTVRFVSEDRVCTMDMAPRATIIDFGDQLDDDADDGFTLELIGDNLDATLQVIEN